MPGGRPRNLWTAARERKLARLYTLSNLKLEEIQRLLKADGFNPCTRDIQKKLGNLLSKDYSRKYHRFRPANYEDARVRLSHLQKCTHHRIRKRCVRGTKASQCLNSNQKNIIKSNTYSSSRLSLALVDYSTPSHYESHYVKPGVLSLEAGSHPLPPLDMVNVAIYPTSSSARIGDAVVSGSGPNANETMRPAPDHKSASDGQISKPLIRKRSTDSLLKLLGRRYSNETLEHIKSILCYSSTNSRRSSLVSSLSFGSSWKSKISFQVGRACSKASYSSISIEDPWTEIDQTIWGELVDEERLVHPIHKRLHSSEISLAIQSRPCCSSMSTKPCGICGTSEAHLLVMWGLLQNPMEWPLWLPTKDQLNAKDNFDNTPLHFAAASGKARLLLLIFLIEEGADIRARNTSGETFMHVLDQTSLGGTKNLCRLLRILAALSFPFSDRDHHGRTIAHSLFNETDIREIPTETWKEISSILKPDIFSLDNLGLDIRGQPRHDSAATKGWPGNKLKSWPDIFEHIAPIPAPIFSDVSKKIKDWLALVTTFNHVTWVDINGDTLLTSMIKCWPDQYEGWLLERIINELIKGGAEINMRDRYGHIPLAIAVGRGFTLTSTALLRAGANVNSRNYEGVGMLSVARASLREARQNNMALYAKILSCMNSIIDDGAKGDPTAYDEYMSREASAKKPRVKREYELGEWFSQSVAEYD